MTAFRVAPLTFAPSRFGAPAAGQGVPPPLLRRARSIRHVMLPHARAVLTRLPAPGESLHALMTGRYDLTHLLLAVIEGYGGRADAVRIATLSFNARNVADLCDLLDQGHVGSLAVLSSAFHRDHDKEGFVRAAAALAQRGARLAAARNHCKVITLALPGNDRLALEGSANLRTNSNREQFCLCNDAGLHDWHAAWIDAEVGRGQSHQGPTA